MSVFYELSGVLLFLIGKNQSCELYSSRIISFYLLQKVQRKDLGVS